MIPYFVIDQIALGPVKLYTWGLFVGLGFSAGCLWFYYLAKKEGLAPKKIVPLCGSIFFGAMLGAWAWARLTAGGGAAFMGGLVGAIICGWIYVKIVNFYSLRSKIPSNPPFLKGGAGGLNPWRVADLLVLPTLLGITIGRIGCILINDHQGAATNLPWGILWPNGIARHPVALYEMLMALGVLATLWLLRKKITQPGQLFLIFLSSYSSLRFLLDFARAASGPLADPRWGMLSASQWLALGIVFAVSFVFWKKKNHLLT